MIKKNDALFGGLDAIMDSAHETIQTSKNSTGQLNYSIVKLSDIELDKSQPRKLKIKPSDLLAGPKKDDPDYKQKIGEYNDLLGLATTIEKYGVQQPIQVWQDGGKYKIAYGERRYLASIIAGKKDIPIGVMTTSMARKHLAELQLIENIARQDLTLSEVLNAIDKLNQKAITNSGKTLTSEGLSKMIGLSKTQCAGYLALLKCKDKKVITAIQNGQIQSLDKAVTVANTRDLVKREKLLEIAVHGGSLFKLRDEKKKEEEAISQPSKPNLREGRGRRATKVNLGSTCNIKVVQELVNVLAKDSRFSELAKLDLSDYKSATVSFKTVLNVLESKVR